MVRYGYNFDDSMYQPAVPDIEHFEVPFFESTYVYKDGSVKRKGDLEFDLVHINEYNVYQIGCGSFKSYQEAGKKFWPHYPPKFKDIDHISRVRSDDSWSNLRRVNRSLNNLNQYRKGVKGYHHETKEWLATVNGYRTKKRLSPLILKEPPRNKYISRIMYLKETYELGCHDTPEQATQCYLESKEQFIQDRIKEAWCKFLFQ